MYCFRKKFIYFFSAIKRSIAKPSKQFLGSWIRGHTTYSYIIFFFLRHAKKRYVPNKIRSSQRRCSAN